MLLSFTVSNFRSIADEQILDLRPSKKKPRYIFLNEAVAESGSAKALKVKVIYGANGSGKSNLIQAFSAFRHIAIHSLIDEKSLLTIRPFMLNDFIQERDTKFEVRLALRGGSYQYGFRTRGNQIAAEWLREERKGKRSALLFSRKGDKFDYSSSNLPEAERLLQPLGKEGDNTLIKPHSLFLTVGAALNVPLFSDIVLLLREIRIVATYENTAALKNYAIEQLSNDDIRRRAVELLRRADMDIDNLEIDREAANEGDRIRIWRSFVSHQGGEKQSMGWGLERNESAGTRRLVYLAPLIVEAILEGRVLIIDEFESQLHTNLSWAIIDLFNTADGNPNGAQLIVATHDTNLLSSGLLRRDQIAFVNKDEAGCSEVYSLSDIKGVRNDESFEREYLGGSYDATHNISRLKVVD